MSIAKLKYFNFKVAAVIYFNFLVQQNRILISSYSGIYFNFQLFRKSAYNKKVIQKTTIHYKTTIQNYYKNYYKLKISENRLKISENQLEISENRLKISENQLEISEKVI